MVSGKKGSYPVVDGDQPVKALFVLGVQAVIALGRAAAQEQR